MNEPTVQKIAAELSDKLIGQKFGKIFALSKAQLAIDFRLSDDEYLFISVESNSPRIYIVNRRFKDLDKASKLQLPFLSVLRKRLAHAAVESIEKIDTERVLKLHLVARNDLGIRKSFTLVVQLTGRSSNLFLLDHRGLILDSLRDTFGVGQVLATSYACPKRETAPIKTDRELFPVGDFSTLSEALDSYYLEKEALSRFQSKAKAATANLSKKLKKKLRLKKALERDLKNHGNPEKWKHFGDVLLANTATAKRNGDVVFVVDYFDNETPTIEITVEENVSITEAAENFFKKYTKARNAKKEIAARMEILSREVKKLEKKKEMLKEAISKCDEDTIESFLGKRSKTSLPKRRNKSEDAFSGAKRYVSEDGFDILVGKRSKDNDYLTFRIAKSLDTWLHAADYPGSHVVIRNPNRKNIPPKTLRVAAQLAAFYSKAKQEAKVAVHYTQKKFVNKPKGAAPGLVSLASFKTILVEPKVSVKRKEG